MKSNVGLGIKLSDIAHGSLVQDFGCHLQHSNRQLIDDRQKDDRQTDRQIGRQTERQIPLRYANLSTLPGKRKLGNSLPRNWGLTYNLYKIIIKKQRMFSTYRKHCV